MQEAGVALRCSPKVNRCDSAVDIRNPTEPRGSNADENRMRRLPAIDALRGLMLVMMTITHMPTRFSDVLGQPIGFVSAAEGFVFLSAFLAGYVATGRAATHGTQASRAWLWRRAGIVYACHVGLLVFLFAVIVPIGSYRAQPAITDLASHFLHSPVSAFVQSLALVYNPPLLDILPFYVLFLAATPLALSVAQKRGWTFVLVASASMWLLVQVGAVRRLFEVLRYVLDVDLPYNQTGSFSFFAWQFLWMLGLWVGYGVATKRAQDNRPPTWVGGIALAYATVWLVWRHMSGQVPQPHGGELNMLFDKWTLGPMRLLDFLSLLVAAMTFGPRIADSMLPGWLGWLGRATLPAFCAHLVVCLIALALFGAANAARPVWLDIALLAAAFGLIVCVARLVGPARAGATAIGGARSPPAR